LNVLILLPSIYYHQVKFQGHCQQEIG